MKECAADICRANGCQIIHITGKKDYEGLRTEYARLKIPSRLFDFCHTMAQVYAVTDAAIARAGAVTVSELALFNIPSVLIPYRFAGGHQKQNALALTRTGLAEIIDENDLNKERLLEKVSRALKNDPSRMTDIEQLRKTFFADSDKRLADSIEALVK